jgi:hypothetical protein
MDQNEEKPSSSHAQGHAAVEAESAERPRRVRRTKQIEGVEAAPDAGAAEAATAAKPEGDSATEAAPAGGEAKEHDRPPSPRRDDFERRPRRADPRSNRAGFSGGPGAQPRSRRPRRPERSGDAPDRAHVGKLAKKTVYRQDVVGTPVPASPSRPAEKEKAKPAPDKLTLILHPAPKAAPWKKKAEAKPMTAKEAMKAKLAKQGSSGQQGAKQHADQGTAIEPAWISTDVEGALDAVRAAGDQGEALVQAWLDKGNVAAIARIASLDAAPGRARKAARRAVNVLKSRGVAIPDASAPAPKPKAAAAEEPEACTASYIPPDGSGMSFFSLTQRLPGGRYRVADIMVRDDAGIVHASAGLLAGKHIRRWKTRVEEQFGTPPIEVPLEWARHAIAEGRKRNDATRQLVPLGYDGCLTLAAPSPSVAPPHPIADLEQSDVSTSEIEKAVLGSDALQVEPEFRTWAPDRGALEELVRKVGERLSSDEAENKDKVDGVLSEEVRAATDRFFTPERRTVLAARMRDAAISVRARNGEDAARRVLALAQAILRAGLVTQPPQDIPFLLAFFQKGMAMLAHESRGRIAVPVGQASV